MGLRFYFNLLFNYYFLCRIYRSLSFRYYILYRVGFYYSINCKLFLLFNPYGLSLYTSVIQFIFLSNILSTIRIKIFHLIVKVTIHLNTCLFTNVLILGFTNISNRDPIS